MSKPVEAVCDCLVKRPINTSQVGSTNETVPQSFARIGEELEQLETEWVFATTFLSFVRIQN